MVAGGTDGGAPVEATDTAGAGPEEVEQAWVEGQQSRGGEHREQAGGPAAVVLRCGIVTCTAVEVA